MPSATAAGALVAAPTDVDRWMAPVAGSSAPRTNALESLVISGWVRGLSDRDIEAALAEVLGPEAARRTRRPRQ